MRSLRWLKKNLFSPAYQPRFAVRGMIFVVLLALLTAPIAALQAQDNSITITLGLPQFVETIITPELIADFESQNPGINVQTIQTGFPAFPSPATASIDDHFTEVEKYMSAADVVFMGSANITPEAAEAGYFLDLSPLTATDSSLNSDDFFPDIWQSVQWDGKVWMMPVSADLVAVVYSKNLFDKAGLAYPSGQWTVDDLDTAARALAETDADGKVTKPGLIISGGYVGLLIRSLLGEGLYDGSVTPNAPSFSNPALEPILTTLAKLSQDGIASTSFSGDPSTIPLQIAGSFNLIALGAGSQPAAALLPGGKAGLETQGFAISAGTLYPEQAYALAKFLSFSAAAANSFLSATPARQSLVGIQAPAPSGDNGGVSIIRPNTPEIQAAITEGLANALPTSETRYTDYVAQAMSRMISDNIDAHTALQNAETLAVANQKAAADKHSNLIVNVATPIPETVLEAGKISLKFGMLSIATPLPNKAQWDQVIQDFVASDPQVGEIKLDTGLNQPAQSAQKFDCFYLPLNYVSQIDPTTILNLDPFIDADPTFDRNDVINGVLAQVQRDNKTWALPIVIQPDGLKYDADAFQKAGIPEPEGGWTINAFTDALKTLKTSPSDKPPFEAQGVGGTYLLLLTAAFGGLPIDYRTSPPTFNFTDPNAITALQQVLDLAKDGYIKYGELAGNGLASFSVVGPGEAAPIYSESFNGFQFGPPPKDQDSYRLTTYPTGSSYNGATYSIGTAYVSTTSQNPEGCYRWLSTLSRHPELFSGMPARLSLLDDPAVVATQKTDETAFYKQFAALLQDPNTIAFPSLLSEASASTFLIERWIDKAFDNYVLHDGDLVTDLATAQTYVQAFTECTAALSPDDQKNQLKYIDCAGKADPNTKSLFGAITGAAGS